MRLMRKDSCAMLIFPPTEVMDAEGSVFRLYGESSGSFFANIQPYKGGLTPFSDMTKDRERGIVLDYNFVVLAYPDERLKEGARIGKEAAEFEIEVVQDWKSHIRLFCKKVIA